MAGKRANGEASYRQRTDGTWEGRAYFDGVRMSFYGKTRGAVAAKVKEAQRRVEQGAQVTTSSERLTLATWLDSWLERVKPTIRQSTWIRYGSLLAHAKRRLGTVTLTKLTPQQIETLYAELMEQGLSSTTVHHLHMALHQALKDAFRKGVVPRNVSELVNVPAMEQHEMHALTQEQAQQFLEASKGERLVLQRRLIVGSPLRGLTLSGLSRLEARRISLGIKPDFMGPALLTVAAVLEALFVLAISTGMRQGELLALHWHDLDVESGALQVRFSVRLQRGNFVFTEPKTKHGKRKIILGPEVLEVLRAHRVRQLQERLVAGSAWNDQDLVFCNECGKPLDGILVYRWPFQRVLRNAELPPIRFHDLRHTAATLMLLTGVPVKVVSEMLGHATVAITLDTYSHVQPSMQEDATAAMRSVLWGSNRGKRTSGGGNGGMKTQ